MDAKQLTERNQTLVGYLKHLTTLSAIAIVLLAGFLQYTFTGQGLGFFVALAVVGFVVSAITCVTFYTLITFAPETGKDDSSSLSARWLTVAALGAWGGFLLGVIGLVAFTIFRLFQGPILY